MNTGYCQIREYRKLSTLNFVLYSFSLEFIFFILTVCRINAFDKGCLFGRRPSGKDSYISRFHGIHRGCVRDNTYPFFKSIVSANGICMSPLVMKFMRISLSGLSKVYFNKAITLIWQHPLSKKTANLHEMGSNFPGNFPPTIRKNPPTRRSSKWLPLVSLSFFRVNKILMCKIELIHIEKCYIIEEISYIIHTFAGFPDL